MRFHCPPTYVYEYRTSYISTPKKTCIAWMHRTAQSLLQRFPEVRREFHVSVRYDSVRHPMQSHHIDNAAHAAGSARWHAPGRRNSGRGDGRDICARRGAARRAVCVSASLRARGARAERTNLGKQRRARGLGSVGVCSQAQGCGEEVSQAS